MQIDRAIICLHEKFDRTLKLWICIKYLCTGDAPIKSCEIAFTCGSLFGHLLSETPLCQRQLLWLLGHLSKTGLFHNFFICNVHNELTHLSITHIWECLLRPVVVFFLLLTKFQMLPRRLNTPSGYYPDALQTRKNRVNRTEGSPNYNSRCEAWNRKHVALIHVNLKPPPWPNGFRAGLPRRCLVDLGIICGRLYECYGTPDTWFP